MCIKFFFPRIAFFVICLIAQLGALTNGAAQNAPFAPGVGTNLAPWLTQLKIGFDERKKIITEEDIAFISAVGFAPSS